MVSPRLAPGVDRVRRGLAAAAAASPGLRRVLAVAGRELSQAAEAGRRDAAREPDDGDYGGRYFGEGRDPSGDRQGLSGYATYDRVSSNADIAAYLLWRNVRAERSLDVGCARGYLVEALRELGVDARGCDVSTYAVTHAAPGARGFVAVGDLASGLPFADGHFDLVTTLEILEHLDPAEVPGALAELRRVCRVALYATIPSFGVSVSGPHGHFEGKVRPERLDHYRSLGDDFEGPVPEADLAVDADGHLIEGHRTIASFGWWTARFAEAGFERRADVERRLYADIEPAGLAPFWNLYLFAVPGTPDDRFEPREPGRSLAELGLVHPLLDADPG